MYRFLKILHLLGLTLFLGSIFSHIVAGQTGGAIGSAEFLASRAQIVAATRALTLPGLGLAVLSGVALAARSPVRQPWMGVHAALASVIVALAAFIIAPAGRDVLGKAATLAQGHGDIEAVLAALNTEHVVGAVNIILTLAVVALGVYKPAIRMLRRCPATPAEQGRT